MKEDMWSFGGRWGDGEADGNAAVDMFLKSTVMDRRHFWVVASSDVISKRWHRENNNRVTLSGAGGC